jgi:DNA polymerase-1
MPILKAKLKVIRYFVRGEFNPRSPVQLLNLMASKGHEGGSSKGSKTGKPSTNKKVLEALAKKDPFYQDILDLRKIQKVKSTYVDGTEARLDSNDRLHAKFKHKPSTLRLSCVDPNLTNVVADKD